MSQLFKKKDSSKCSMDNLRKFFCKEYQDQQQLVSNMSSINNSVSLDIKNKYFFPYLNERDTLGKLICNQSKFNKSKNKNLTEGLILQQNQLDESNIKNLDSKNESKIYMPKLKFNGSILDNSSNTKSLKNLKIGLVRDPKKQPTNIPLAGLQNIKYSQIQTKQPCYKISQTVHVKKPNQYIEIQNKLYDQQIQNIDTKPNLPESNQNNIFKIKKQLKYKIYDDQLNLKLNDVQFIGDFENSVKNALNYGKVLRNKINQLRMVGNNEAD